MKTVPALILAGALFAVPLHAQMFTYESFEGYAAGVQVETGANGSSGTGLDGGAGWGGAYNVNNAIKSLVKIEDRSTSTFLYNNGAIALEGGVRALRFFNAANGVSALIRPLASAHAAGTPLFRIELLP